MNPANEPAAIDAFEAMISAWDASSASDIDLIILATRSAIYLQDTARVSRFGASVMQAD